MSDLYVCKEYETPFSEGYRVVRTIEEHNKMIYNQALDDFVDKAKELYPNDSNALYKLMCIAGQLKEQK